MDDAICTRYHKRIAKGLWLVIDCVNLSRLGRQKPRWSACLFAHEDEPQLGDDQPRDGVGAFMHRHTQTFATADEAFKAMFDWARETYSVSDNAV